MPNDMEIIKQIEKQLGIKLRPVPLEEIFGLNGFALDDAGQVKGLNPEFKRFMRVNQSRIED
jgi:hypothetical protein